MKHNTILARETAAVAGLERLKNLEEQLGATSANSGRRRELSAAIRIEADAYRKSLDTEQAMATHDARPQFTVSFGSLNRASARKPTLAARRNISSLSRPAPRKSR